MSNYEGLFFPAYKTHVFVVNSIALIRLNFINFCKNTLATDSFSICFRCFFEGILNFLCTFFQSFCASVSVRVFCLANYICLCYCRFFVFLILPCLSVCMQLVFVPPSSLSLYLRFYLSYPSVCLYL